MEEALDHFLYHWDRQKSILLNWQPTYKQSHSLGSVGCFKGGVMLEVGPLWLGTVDLRTLNDYSYVKPLEMIEMICFCSYITSMCLKFTLQWRTFCSLLSSPRLSGLFSAEEINSITLWLRISHIGEHRGNKLKPDLWIDFGNYSLWLLFLLPYMSDLDTVPVLLSVMLLISHEFFWGFGDSNRFTISSITSVGMGWDLLWFLLMHDSKSHCR